MRIMVHLDTTDDGEEVWWAESDEHPFSAAAPTLEDLKALVSGALEMEAWGEPDYYLTATDAALRAEEGRRAVEVRTVSDADGPCPDSTLILLRDPDPEPPPPDA